MSLKTLEQYAQQAAAAYKSYLTEEDTQECASFLLALKHRSVTPEPPEIDDERPSTSDRSCIPDVQVPKHQPEPSKKIYDSDDGAAQNAPALLDEQLTGEASLDALLGDSQLVFPSDRDLVPDPLFVAMAQMKPCSLTEADRVGCYKAREIGFTGMSCKHCGGQPGFGKYFPASVRSLAQTTTSQTILKHVGSKCRFCPPHIRQAVLELQRQQVAKEGSNAGRPRYGSRKVFFQRIWGRLHGEPIPEASKVVSEPISLPPSLPPSDDDRSVSSSEAELASYETGRRKHRFGVLPTQKNLKRKKATLERPPKRSRLEFAV